MHCNRMLRRKLDRLPFVSRFGNRGVALELAISFLTLVFALCLILTTVTMGIYQQNRKMEHWSAQRFALDQIGEDFVIAVRDDDVYPPRDENDKSEWVKCTGTDGRTYEARTLIKKDQSGNVLTGKEIVSIHTMTVRDPKNPDMTLLVVTVRKTISESLIRSKTSTYEVLNWSTSVCSVDSNTDNTEEWENRNWLSDLLTAIINIVRSLVRGAINSIADAISSLWR